MNFVVVQSIIKSNKKKYIETNIKLKIIQAKQV